MDIVQLVALAVGILTLVWHQQRSVAALRTEMKQEIAALRDELRAEFRAEISGLRAEIGGLRAEMREEIAALRAEIAALRDAVNANSQRLSRIEGYLGVGMPPEAAAMAPGVRFAAARMETAPAVPDPAASGLMPSS